ncbi:peptidoglycan-binding domain-containing protein [Streptomyces crystallinus]|uniref:Peptidoglycan-binding domain-containing protein n=1 Tax=Streptomyces crystallinus TaxID=68191 RepID=A0ABP3R9X0_9ACTN
MKPQACPECARHHEPVPGPCPARAAEPATAEDFDPLRIRPYVTLENVGAAPSGGEVGQGAEPELGTTGNPELTMPLTPVPSGAAHARAEESTQDQPVLLGARGTAREEATDPHPTTHAPAGGPAQDDPVLLGARGTARPAHDGPQTSRRRRLPLLLALAATAALVAYAASQTLFAGASDNTAGAATTVSTAPDDASPTPTATATPTPTGTGTARTTTPTPHRTGTPTRTPKPSRHPATTPTPTPSKITGTGAVGTSTAPAPPPPAATTAPATAPVLRKGDNGPEVAELQDRLAQLTIYNGKIDGHFGSKTENAVRTYQSYMGLEADPPGVYGPETRRALEAQTS